MSFIIDGQEYLSAKEAADLSKYTPDYITRLCREGQVKAKRLGRAWVIERTSLISFQRHVYIEEEKRKDELRQERISEYRKNGKTKHKTEPSLPHQKPHNANETLLIRASGVALGGAVLVLALVFFPNIVDWHGRFVDQTKQMWSDRDLVARHIARDIKEGALDAKEEYLAIGNSFVNFSHTLIPFYTDVFIPGIVHSPENFLSFAKNLPRHISLMPETFSNVDRNLIRQMSLMLRFNQRGTFLKLFSEVLLACSKHLRHHVRLLNRLNLSSKK
jgi:hypothetical protein